MRITHLGHACLLVQAGGSQLLIDPGVYSSGFENLTGLAAVLVTHQHPDHVDVDLLPDLLDANPDAEALIEPETVASLDLAAAATPFPAGSSRRVGDFSVTAVGGEHARNHDLVPPIGNVGLLVSEDGGPTLFHPGDSYADAPPGVDVLAFPLNAPWARVSETLAFVRAVAAPMAFPIHDGLLNPKGRAAYLMHVEKYAQTGRDLRDLSDGAPFVV
jgi:L-ascorbate metabolism protein UlaG (beta-lactamase superfamily)